MVIQLLTADTIGGINHFWKVIASENQFFIGREICFQAFKNKRYVGWRNSNKKDICNSWGEFKIANKIKNINTINMSLAIEVSKILDKYLPPNGVGTEREMLRMNLHREISILVSENINKQ